ncbi:MAG: DNA translocase FtsK [Saprospiraceae bacterium]|nr:DNA translocase FtsK [Saprospiraceae bacterium]
MKRKQNRTKSGSRQRRKKTIRPRKRDDRWPKLAGAASLLISCYLAIAFVSYLFTWQIDQDKVLQFSWSILAQGDLQVENWLGRLGAVVSNFFFYWGFGVASFIFVLLFGKLGITWLFGQPMKSFWRSARMGVLGLVFTSLILEFVLGRMAFPWGGAFGESTSVWLSNFLGNAGLFLFLVFAFAVYLIWMFNPNLGQPASWLALRFNLPNWKRTPKKAAFAGIDSVTDADETPPLQPTFLEQFRERQQDTKAAPADTPAADGIEFDLDESKPQKAAAPTRPETDTELEIAAPEEENGNPVNPSSTIEEHLHHDPRVSIVEKENMDHSEPYDPKADLSRYEPPELELLMDYSDQKVQIDRAELEANKDQIIETLLNYKIEITKIRATIGPTVTLYEIVPAPGVRISRIKNLEDDIALSLSALGIRIIAPMPGKGTIGIEVPNKKKQIVALKEVLKSEKYASAKMDLPVVLGKTISNEVFVADLAKMPHLLVAGATGQGKSVGINTILMSLLYKKHPSQIKFVLIDPKKVELFPYSRLEKHFLAYMPDQEEPIITETKRVIHVLNSLCIEMDQRYDLLKKARARNIREYNDKFVNRKINPKNGHRFLPFIILVIDEFADLIMTAGKEVELPIGRLAQLARAVGIHLIIATQRPSVNIITGVIKANFPARLAYKVTSKVDSRTILDVGGAEQLIGRGDMLLSIGSNLIRLQCAFVDTPEVEAVINAIGDQQGYPEPFYLPEYKDDNEPINGADGLTFSELDEMFEDAARLVVQNQHGSTSMIQRRLKLGYNRAGRIMDQLEAVGVVGPNEGSKAREVLIYNEMELDEFLESLRS